MKYAKIENNIVVQVQPDKQEGFIEVDDSVICGMIKSGEIYIIPRKTDKEAEEQRILAIKQKAQSVILEKYPLEKQSSANLGLYGQEYLDNMKAYILNIITISNKAESNGTLLEDINWNV